jgi:hypothetical protein
MHLSWKCRCAFFAASVLLNCAVSQAQEAFEFFHPLIVRQPVIEQQVEIQAARGVSEAARNAAVDVAVDYRVTSRWQVEPLLPVLWSKAQNSQSEFGLGDVEFENKFLVLAPKRRTLLVAGGLDVTFPSGSTARGLGGNTGLTPFFTAGTRVRSLDLLCDLSYGWAFRGPDRSRRRVDGGLAAGVHILPWIVPFIEMTGGPGIVAGPGVHINLSPGRSLLFGVEKSVTRARDFDTQLRVGLVWDVHSRNN